MNIRFMNITNRRSCIMWRTLLAPGGNSLVNEVHENRLCSLIKLLPENRFTRTVDHFRLYERTFSQHLPTTIIKLSRPQRTRAAKYVLIIKLYLINSQADCQQVHGVALMCYRICPDIQMGLSNTCFVWIINSVILHKKGTPPKYDKSVACLIYHVTKHDNDLKLH
jgi:hypothetical protein